MQMDSDPLFFVERRQRMSTYEENQGTDYKRFLDRFQTLSNAYKYRYRIYKKYGISISIYGAYTSMSSYEDKDACTAICSGLWAIYPADMQIPSAFGVSEKEKYLLWEGLKKVSELIIHKSPYQSDTLIVIHFISSHDCHYQEEGLTPAIMMWAANAFGFQPPQIDVHFNEELGKIEFLFD
jgi:hypothetical protein